MCDPSSTSGPPTKILPPVAPRFTPAQIPADKSRTPRPNSRDTQCRERIRKRRCRSSSLERRRYSYVERAKNAASIATATGSTIIIHYFLPWQKNSISLPKEQLVEGWIQHTSNTHPHPIGGWWKESIQAKVMLGLRRYKVLENITSQILRKIEEIHIPQIIENPLPPVFLAACISFALAMAAFRHSHRHDSFQNHIVGAGILVGIAAASVSDDFLMSAKTAIPWSVIFGLIPSSLVHRVLGLLSSTEINISREKMWTEGGK